MGEGPGRPSKYDPKYCEEMVKWFSSGAEWSACPTFERYAVTINVNASTLRNWKDEHEDFLAAYKQCKNIQFSIMFEGGISKEFDGGFTKFAMMNMHKWKNVQDHSGEVAHNVSFEIREYEEDDQAV